MNLRKSYHTALNEIGKLSKEVERLREERDIYRTALLRITESPRMNDPGELPRYIAKDALHAGVKARHKGDK